MITKQLLEKRMEEIKGQSVQGDSPLEQSMIDFIRNLSKEDSDLFIEKFADCEQRIQKIKEEMLELFIQFSRRYKK